MEMNNNKITSKEKGACEKIFNALSMSSGFIIRRRIRHHEHTSKPHPNQQPPPPRNYTEQSKPQSTDPSRHYGHVPIMFEGHSNLTNVAANHVTDGRKAREDKTNISGKKTSSKIRVERMDSGGGKSRVNGGVMEHAFSDYIDHAGSRIRAGTNVGFPAKITSLRRKDSINSKVSDYINRTKIRFQSPSYVDNDE